MDRKSGEGGTLLLGSEKSRRRCELVIRLARSASEGMNFCSKLKHAEIDMLAYRHARQIIAPRSLDELGVPADNLLLEGMPDCVHLRGLADWEVLVCCINHGEESLTVLYRFFFELLHRLLSSFEALRSEQVVVEGADARHDGVPVGRDGLLEALVFFILDPELRPSINPKPEGWDDYVGHVDSIYKDANGHVLVGKVPHMVLVDVVRTRQYPAEKLIAIERDFHVLCEARSEEAIESA